VAPFAQFGIGFGVLASVWAWPSWLLVDEQRGELICLGLAVEGEMGAALRTGGDFCCSCGAPTRTAANHWGAKGAFLLLLTCSLGLLARFGVARAQLCKLRNESHFGIGLHPNGPTQCG